MKQITFDFNNMFSVNVGRAHGVRENDIANLSLSISRAHRHLQKIISRDDLRVNLSLEWAILPFQSSEVVEKIQSIGDEIARNFENVIFLGIGGSYLGLKAAQDALVPAYFNEFPYLRKKRPRIYFEGNNLDPATLSVLLKSLDAGKTFVVVISKSGETTETKAAFCMVEDWLKKRVGSCYGRQIIAITDPKSGALRKKVIQEQSKDILSFRSLPLLRGVGGRFSEFNMGLLHLAVIGVKVQEVLDGAAAMAKRCSCSSIYRNPAYMYAVLHVILYRNKSKSIGIMMPFSETLKSTADWYSQMLAESLGKKYPRIVKAGKDGSETWEENKNRIINVGRTPVACRGTNDLHSVQQNNIEGENNKTITFIRVNKFRNDLVLPKSGDILSGKTYSSLLALAQEATEWALTRESRPSCTINMPEVSPYHWGELLFFFELATAFEGELMNVNAFDQPGVEGYKNYMYFKLHKPGLSEEIRKEIKARPLTKKSKYII